MSMLYFEDVSKIKFAWCGHSQALSENWIHLSRTLANYELIVVTEGTLFIADHQREYAVNESEYLLMAPTLHQYGYRPGKCTFRWMHFEGTAAAYHEETGGEGKGRGIMMLEYGRLALADRIVYLMEQLQDSAHRYHSRGLNDSLTSVILYDISCQGEVYNKQKQPWQTVQIFNDIVDYIRYHICEDIRVSDLALYFGYNSKYLSALFKERTGMTIKQFILHSKMENAMAELRDTDHTVSQVAYGLGFQDVHNFTNAFKKIAGLSPSHYRDAKEIHGCYFNCK